MTERTDKGPLSQGSAEAEGLRVTVERLRRQAEAEIARLNRRLAEREYAMEVTVVSVTERQAMQQELDTLRHSLGAKEKTLDRITDECRRLEDRLEDQHLAFDGLKQEVQRKETSLQAARDELARLKRQLAELHDQSLDLSAVAAQVQAASPLPLPPVEPDVPPRLGSRVISFSVGVMAALAVIAIVAVLFWSGRGLDPAVLWPESQAPASIDVQPTQAPGAVPEPQNETAASGAVVVPLEAVPSPSESLPTLRDRLRDGSPGPTLVVLPGGVFRMGHNSLGGSDSGPERDVRVAPFLIGAYEVTFQQYDRFARATGRRLPDDFGWGRGDRPVVAVAWSDAQAYVDWLTRQADKRYRLASEAEWEFAARAGVHASYPWGFRMESGRAACFDCGSRWDNRSAAPVGSFPPNAFGLYDLAGNVLEWVADCYAPGYDGAPNDGSPRVERHCTYRVARGGAFNRPASSIRTHARTRFLPDTRLNNLGFRVAREP